MIINVPRTYTTVWRKTLQVNFFFFGGYQLRLITPACLGVAFVCYDKQAREPRHPGSLQKQNTWLLIHMRRIIIINKYVYVNWNGGRESYRDTRKIRGACTKRKQILSTSKRYMVKKGIATKSKTRCLTIYNNLRYANRMRKEKNLEPNWMATSDKVLWEHIDTVYVIYGTWFSGDMRNRAISRVKITFERRGGFPKLNDGTANEISPGKSILLH